MLDKQKLFRMTAVIAVVLILAVSFLYVGEKSKSASLKKALDNLNKKFLASESELRSAKNEVVRLNQKIQLVESELRAKQDELDNIAVIKQEVMSQLDNTRTELEKQVYQKLDLEQRLNKAKEEVRNLQEQIDKMDVMRLDLEAKIRDIEESNPSPETKSNNIELGQIVVSAAERVMPDKPLKGTVLVVNKEYNFAVINLGSKDGLAIDDSISVYDRDKFIGDVKVEKLQEAMAAVNFSSLRLKEKLVAEKDYTFKLK